MIHVRGGLTQHNYGPLNFRCPSCRHIGAFGQLKDVPDLSWTNVEIAANGQDVTAGYKAGLRTCPNKECRALVMWHQDPEGLLHLEPPKVIDFDASNLPERILASLEEATKCHAAGCYRASALMIRRVLEELCEDKQAQGGNLMQRLAALGQTIVIPQGLLTAADELRLLGNDAAHVEAKTYDQIGADECEIAIELAKELLKAVYQYTNLVAKLQALKKHTPQ